MPGTTAAAATPTSSPTPSNLRLRRPDRDQVVWAAAAVDALIPPDHQARVIWAVVRTADLSAFPEPIKARSGVCGRDATDPAKLDQRYVPKPDDSPAVAAWRVRMGTEAARAVYRERASTVETVNADLKTHRGMARFLVRGTDQVLSCALFSAIAYNLLHFGTQLTA